MQAFFRARERPRCGAWRDAPPPTVMSVTPAQETQALSVDYVLKFEGLPLRYAQGQARAPASVMEERANELTRLMQRLRDVGLQCVSRPGKKGTGDVLVFITAPDHALYALRRAERYVGPC